MTLTLDMIEKRLAQLAAQESELWAKLNACRGAAEELRCWRELSVAPEKPASGLHLAESLPGESGDSRSQGVQL